MQCTQQPVDMWIMCLRHTGAARGQRLALPTAIALIHMPTGSYDDD